MSIRVNKKMGGGPDKIKEVQCFSETEVCEQQVSRVHVVEQGLWGRKGYLEHEA